MASEPSPFRPTGQWRTQSAGKKLSWKRAFHYVGLGLALQIGIYAAAIVSLGFGHGSDNIADFLFPISNMMFGGNFSERSYPVALIDHLQYVIYTVAICLAGDFGKVAAGFLIVVIMHVVAFAISL
jgi:hypothetical protein